MWINWHRHDNQPSWRSLKVLLVACKPEIVNNSLQKSVWDVLSINWWFMSDAHQNSPQLLFAAPLNASQSSLQADMQHHVRNTKCCVYCQYTWVYILKLHYIFVFCHMASAALPICCLWQVTDAAASKLHSLFYIWREAVRKRNVKRISLVTTPRGTIFHLKLKLLLIIWPQTWQKMFVLLATAHIKLYMKAWDDVAFEIMFLLLYVFWTHTAASDELWQALCKHVC